LPKRVVDHRKHSSLSALFFVDSEKTNIDLKIEPLNQRGFLLMRRAVEKSAKFFDYSPRHEADAPRI